MLSYQARMTHLWTEALSLAVQSEWGWGGQGESAQVCDKHIYACVGEGGSKMGLRKHMDKASEGDRIPVELFQILKDDAVKVLHSICEQI